MSVRMGFRPQVRAIIACLLLPLHLVACTTWHVQPAAPQTVLATAPGKVRLTLTDGHRIEMAHPRIDGDSVRGMNEDGADSGPVAVPLAHVQRVEVRRPSTGKTVGLVLGVVVLVGAAAYGAYWATVCAGGGCD